jgi:hypothetical protein
VSRIMAAAYITSHHMMRVCSIAVNALIYGRKRWALLPPPAAQYSTRHPTLTFAELDEATAKGGPKGTKGTNGMPSFRSVTHIRCLYIQGPCTSIWPLVARYGIA